MGRKTVGRFVLNSTTGVAVGANSNVIFTNSTISTNCISYNATTGEIQIKAPGLYLILGNFTVSGTAEGNVTVQLLENGGTVPGASSSATIPAADDLASLSFNAVATVEPSCNNGNFATITIQNVTATDYTVANLIIEKIA